MIAVITDLKDIRQLRNRLGITQSQLAIHAGVSQSLIAKVEAGTIEPTYSNGRKILDALLSLSHTEEKQADEIMQKKIIMLTPEEDIHKAVMSMKKWGISQLPVVDKGQMVGYVSDSTLLDHILENKNQTIGEIMQDPPPVVSRTASITVISSILRFYPFVMVSRKGRLIGIITKSDIISNV